MLNKTQQIGYLTKDPELKYAGANNVAIVSFTLAVNRRFTKAGEEAQADFILCKAFGKTAEFISNHFTKGKQMALCGRIQTGSYEKEGQRIYTTEVIAEEVYFCGGKADAVKQGGADAQFTPIEIDDSSELPF